MWRFVVGLFGWWRETVKDLTNLWTTALNMRAVVLQGFAVRLRLGLCQFTEERNTRFAWLDFV